MNTFVPPISSANGLSAAVSPASSLAPSSSPNDSFDAERFSRLMESASAARYAPPVATFTTGPTASHSLGDRVLAGVSRLGEDFKKSWQQVVEVVGQDERDLSLQELVRVQLQLVRVAAEYEMIGKAIGKSTQNVDQLLRTQ